MNTCEATPSAAQEIRIQSLGTPEIDSPLSRNLATGGERRVVFTVDEELVDEGAAPRPMSFELAPATGSTSIRARRNAPS